MAGSVKKRCPDTESRALVQPGWATAALPSRAPCPASVSEPHDVVTLPRRTEDQSVFASPVGASRITSNNAACGFVHVVRCADPCGGAHEGERAGDGRSEVEGDGETRERRREESGR